MWILKKLANLFRHCKFRTCHEKNQGESPWIFRQHVTFVRQVFVLLGETVTNSQNMDCLSTRKSLLLEVYDPVIKLMGSTIVSMNSFIQENNIVQLERAPVSCNYFKNSIEGIPPNQILYPVSEITNAKINPPLFKISGWISNDKGLEFVTTTAGNQP